VACRFWCGVGGAATTIWTGSYGGLLVLAAAGGGGAGDGIVLRLILLLPAMPRNGNTRICRNDGWSNCRVSTTQVYRGGGGGGGGGYPAGGTAGTSVFWCYRKAQAVAAAEIMLSMALYGVGSGTTASGSTAQAVARFQAVQGDSNYPTNAGMGGYGSQNAGYPGRCLLFPGESCFFYPRSRRGLC